MFYLLKTKKLLSKLITFMLPKKLRKNVRNFLFYFSVIDYFSFKKQNFHIVSLGSNCLPRVLTTAVKLKPRKIYGEKTLPFDLKYSLDLNQTANLIKNDFANFFDNLKITKETYPHDFHLTREQFEKRYQKRIENFFEIINSPKNIFFIYSNFDQTPDKNTVNNLYKILKQKRKGKPFKIILLTAKPIKNVNNPNIKIITENFKIKDGTWVESFINDYGTINNEYSKFCSKVGRQLTDFIS